MNKPMKNQAFTLVELLITVAIIGIIAAVAIPAYRNYMLSAKYAELVSAAQAYQIGIEEYVAMLGLTDPFGSFACGQNNSYSVFIPADQFGGVSQYVQSIQVNAACVITVTAVAGEGMLGFDLFVMPTMDSIGRVTWTYSGLPVDLGYVNNN